MKKDDPKLVNAVEKGKDRGESNKNDDRKVFVEPDIRSEGKLYDRVGFTF